MFRFELYYFLIALADFQRQIVQLFLKTYFGF